MLKRKPPYVRGSEESEWPWQDRLVVDTLPAALCTITCVVTNLYADLIKQGIMLFLIVRVIFIRGHVEEINLVGKIHV
jgi:hypothetical protein